VQKKFDATQPGADPRAIKIGLGGGE
jgi:hypothetical protein